MTFDGLYMFEWVLMVLGVILFIVLVIAFLYQIMHKQSIGALLGFFVVPILMIGYPSIQSFKLADVEVNVQKTTDALHADPADAATRQTLEQQVAQLRKRSFSDPVILTSLSKAEFALGNEQTAKDTLNKALQANPALPAATALKAKIASVDQLPELTSKVESNPTDQLARNQLNQAVAAATKEPIANPTALSKVAHAQTLLGENASAAKNTAIVQKINPKLLMAAPGAH